MIAQVWILGTGHTVSRGSVLFFPGAHGGRAGGRVWCPRPWLRFFHRLMSRFEPLLPVSQDSRSYCLALLNQAEEWYHT